jgi:hypothetical protein
MRRPSLYQKRWRMPVAPWLPSSYAAWFERIGMGATGYSPVIWDVSALAAFATGPPILAPVLHRCSHPKAGST